MNKTDLVAAVADELDMPRTRTTDVVDAVLAAITDALKREDEVRLVGFGTFTVSRRKGGPGRNPRTGEEITVPPSVSVKFRPGKGLKDALL